MPSTTGTLHILRNFEDIIDNSGVYDVAYTLDDSNAELEKAEHIRRFYGEQELMEFLKRLKRGREEVEDVLHQLETEGRARISGLQLPPEDLRDLKLAA